MGMRFKVRNDSAIEKPTRSDFKAGFKFSNISNINVGSLPEINVKKCSFDVEEVNPVFARLHKDVVYSKHSCNHGKAHHKVRSASRKPQKKGNRRVRLLSIVHSNYVTS